MASAGNDSRMVGGLVLSTSRKASSASSAPKASACTSARRGDRALRGALDVAVELAVGHVVDAAAGLRIRMVPSTNTASRCQPGKPSAAIHSALSVGHSSSSQPAGRSQRIRSR
jgi:hypothetical protein